jgi:hypothetical protein
MKKSKFLIFAALAAAATISVGCSNDDVVTTKDSGVPLKVITSVNGISSGSTRATDLTSETFSSFKLHAIGSTEDWANVTVSKSGNEWTGTSSLVWPSGTSNFYAFSTDANIKTDDVKYGNSTQSFTYEMPVIGETTTVDASKQTDLLVAKALEQTATTNGGGIVLNFKHALATLNLSAFFEPNRDDASVDVENYYCLIRSLTIHNLPINGTFTFNSGTSNIGTWSNKTKIGDYTITFAEPVLLSSNQVGGVSPVKSLSPANGSEMFIPFENSEVTYTTKAELLDKADIPSGVVYISLDCKVAQATKPLNDYFDVSDTDEAFDQVYVGSGDEDTTYGDPYNAYVWKHSTNDNFYGTLIIPVTLKKGLKFNGAHSFKFNIANGLLFGADDVWTHLIEAGGVDNPT